MFKNMNVCMYLYDVSVYYGELVMATELPHKAICNIALTFSHIYRKTLELI